MNIFEALNQVPEWQRILYLAFNFAFYEIGKATGRWIGKATGRWLLNRPARKCGHDQPEA
ncbi:hypothetical protein J4U01_gp113 [Mycobacterium phage Kumao]|uniref:Uncharacterized protein n=1 Tax=Mycobacterium phage Kumao TaxID=2041344 RepID=A0A2D1GQ01_9CAUD|nr:hypothetical protein J4U01_gp113 [Mycobacterium phage Kumao]ATN94045.1 hypothetical protein SEA_KUMAO_83 [Mycobacterium phage Kumao]